MSKETAAVTTKIGGRYLFLIAAFICMLVAVVARLGYLHVVKHDFLRSQGEARTMREVAIAAYRGIIKDRNGESLAVSTQVDSVWINPQEFDAQDPKLDHLARLLDIPSKAISEKAERYALLRREFVYLRRHIEPHLGKKIKNLKMSGVHLMPEYRRFYPAGEVTAHVLGQTNVDDSGIEGLELAYNDWLQGKPGRKLVQRDRLGREVESLEIISEVQNGQDLVLSMDSRLQYLAYKALKHAVSEQKAKAGSAVVLDVQTGEVLAMVNAPSFNPNQRIVLRPGDSNVQFRNTAVTDAFEPGSVLKTFGMASVLERVKITPGTVVDTNPGYLKLPGGIVRDLRDNGVLEVDKILKESSNIGLTKLVMNIQPKDLCETYQQLGFGEITGSGFPGENSGVLTTPQPEQIFVQATMSFGYAVSVTPLQLARAYATIGAGGIKRPVSFVKIQDGAAIGGERVLKPAVARQLLDMLSIAADHNRSNARVSGYRVAGKSGTAHKASKYGGYDRDSYRSMFAGLAPAINPRVAIVVAIDEPRAGEYYGNQVAAPVFSRIASGALRLFKIAPDVMDTHGIHIASSLKSKKPGNSGQNAQ